MEVARGPPTYELVVEIIVEALGEERVGKDNEEERENCGLG